MLSKYPGRKCLEKGQTSFMDDPLSHTSFQCNDQTFGVSILLLCGH